MAEASAGGVLFHEFLDGSYDCIDRIVLRAYFRFAQAPAGFRTWWRRWQGSDEGLDKMHLMRLAGRFARRVKAWAQSAGVPIVYSKPGERNEDLVQCHLPEDPSFQGVFLIVVGRAPGNVWDVEHTADGRIRRIKRKEPRAWVNHYHFHIMDPEWGHLIIRFCPHPPFNALVVLNGHEWVAREAQRQGIEFTKQDNCFTVLSNARDLGLVADTLSSSESSVGRLVRVSERWIYSSVSCFALDLADQERTGFRYDYSFFQAEYSRNLLFTNGAQMEQVFSGLIDRIRGPLDVRTVNTLFGRRQRPRPHKGQPKPPVVEATLEKPVYDLTILRLRYGRMTLKIYTKGERVLRIEAMVHNIRDLPCRRSIIYFVEVVSALRQMVQRFVDVRDCLDTAFVDPGHLDELSQPGILGATRVGGMDLNRARMRAVMAAVLALSLAPTGFSASDVAAKVHEILPQEPYSASRAAYDLRKLRCKNLVSKKPRSRRYQIEPTGLRAMAALLVLREKILRPLLAAAARSEPARTPRVDSLLDRRYQAVQQSMQELLPLLGIAA